MNKKSARRVLALLLALSALWAAVFTTGCEDLSSAVSAWKGSLQLPRRLLQWELGSPFQDSPLSPVTALALHQSPCLMAQRTAVTALLRQALPQDADPTEAMTPEEVLPQEQAEPPAAAPEDLHAGLEFLENGKPAETICPASSSGYTVVNDVYIKNTSSLSLDAEALAPMDFSARLGSDGPQVLIIHSHGSEAFSMPPGQEYIATGSYRSADERCNILRAGDEVAEILSQRGISVLHDRTLHDVPSYNDSYSSSLAAMEEYRSQYPSLVFILDIHRDAIATGDGDQYKLISREDPHAAQVSLVMGNAYDGWQDNLKLALAVQSHLAREHPTLMRPITVRGYRYNQHLTPGAMLVEIGAAGNSMDEVILSSRIFAHGFADTILEASGQ